MCFDACRGVGSKSSNTVLGSSAARKMHCNGYMPVLSLLQLQVEHITASVYGNMEKYT